MGLCVALLLQTLEAWIDALRSEDVEERHRAEAALAAAGPDVRCRLETLRSDPDLDVRSVAAGLLRRLQFLDVLPPAVVAAEPRLPDLLARGRWRDALTREVAVRAFRVHPTDRKALWDALLDAARAQGEAVAFCREVRELWAEEAAPAIVRLHRTSDGDLREEAWATLEHLVLRKHLGHFEQEEDVRRVPVDLPFGGVVEVRFTRIGPRKTVLDDREVREGDAVPALGLRVVRLARNRIEIAPLAP